MATTLPLDAHETKEEIEDAIRNREELQGMWRNAIQKWSEWIDDSYRHISTLQREINILSERLDNLNGVERPL